MPHPLEQLRYVARSWEIGEELPALEVASVLGQLAEESPSMLLQACRRMIEYFPGSGVAWWLSARAISAPDPAEAIWAAADELAEDPTPRELAEALPEQASVAFSPLTSVVSAALRLRKDVRPQRKLGPAQMLVVGAQAAGPAGVLVTQRSARAVVAAGSAGKPVWAVLARGALLPAELWEHLLDLALPGQQAEVVEAGALAAVVGEAGSLPPAPALAKTTCPPVAELRGWRI